MLGYSLKLPPLKEEGEEVAQANKMAEEFDPRHCEEAIINPPATLPRLISTATTTYTMESQDFNRITDALRKVMETVMKHRSHVPQDCPSDIRHELGTKVQP